MSGGLLSSKKKDDILAQLNTILDSKDFSGSDRFRKFLSFVVHETLAGREHEIKAYTIATCVFDRDRNFDSLLDPVVRVEASKLRGKLENYYLRRHGSGKDLIKIEIPKGTYVPTFTYIAPNNISDKNLAAPGPKQAEQHSTALLQRSSAKEQDIVAAEQKITPVSENAFSQSKLQASSQLYKTSIAILPFTNMSSAKEIDYLLNGVAEELAIALTRFEDIMVISAYGMNQNNPVMDKQISYNLPGVRFLLCGSGQFDKKNFRMRIKLLDASSHCTLWAEKFNTPYTTTGLFGIVDATVDQVAARVGDSFGYIKRTLFKERPARHTEEIKAYEAILLYHNWAANLQNDRFVRAKEALEAAITIDPNYALAHAMLADIYATHYQWGYSLFPHDLEKAQELSHRSLELDSHCQHAQWSKAYLCYLTRDKEQFEHLARLTLSINPADTNIAAAIGQKLALLGNWEEGLGIIEETLKLNPFLPDWFRAGTYAYYYQNGDFEAALSEAKQITTPSMAPMLRAAAYGILGFKEEAQKELLDFLDINPTFATEHQELLTRIFFQESLVAALTKGFKVAGL